MPRAFDKLTTSIAQTVPELRTAQARGVQKAALEAKTIINTEIRKVAGADMRLSGAGKRGARVGARYDIKGSTNPTALIRALGPIQLIERDTKPHLIAPRASFVTRGGVRVRQGRRSAAGRRLRGGKTALTIGGNLRASAEHPGTKGRHPFQRGAEKASKVTPEIFQAEVDRGLRRAWT